MASGKDFLNFKEQGILVPGHRRCYFLQKQVSHDPHQCTIAFECLNSFSELSDFEGAVVHLVFMKDRPGLNGSVAVVSEIPCDESLRVRLQQ